MTTMDRMKMIASLQTYLSERIATMNADLKDMLEAAASNSKSTAGDKHDTEREMVHIEMENLSKRVENEQLLLRQVARCAERSTAEKIETGSFVRTDDHLFFIGAALGVVRVDGQTITGISDQSPVGGALLGKKSGDMVQVNGRTFNIHEIA